MVASVFAGRLYFLLSVHLVIHFYAIFSMPLYMVYDDEDSINVHG